MIVAYGTHLDDEGYGYATEYLELTTIKQCIHTLRREFAVQGLADCTFALTKPGETTTYCYKPAEVQAMLARCREQEQLKWLERVLIALVHTGLRISELVAPFGRRTPRLYGFVNAWIQPVSVRLSSEVALQNCFNEGRPFVNRVSRTAGVPFFNPSVARVPS
ncbi:MAG: hypothetical protein ACOC9P_02425 [bacterium]